MINKFLHAITNRKALSTDPMFASDTNFAPALLDPQASAMRTALCLDYTGSDYYLRVYASVMNAFPDIQGQLNDFATTYAVTDFLPAGVFMDGARFVNNTTLQGRYLDLQPITLPVGLTYTIAFVSPGSCSIKQEETGIIVAASCRAMTDVRETVLHVDWPLGIPFYGPLSLDQAWVNDCTICIQTCPSGFPYRAALDALLRNSYFVTLLQNKGMMQAFRTTADVREQLAIALLLIAVSNPSVYVQ
jgi:hypothetical protein